MCGSVKKHVPMTHVNEFGDFLRTSLGFTKTFCWFSLARATLVGLKDLKGGKREKVGGRQGLRVKETKRHKKDALDCQAAKKSQRPTTDVGADTSAHNIFTLSASVAPSPWLRLSSLIKQ